MYDKDLVELGQKVQFLAANDIITNKTIVKIDTKRGRFFINTGETFNLQTGRQIGNRVGKIINMFHFSRI